MDSSQGCSIETDLISCILLKRIRKRMAPHFLLLSAAIVASASAQCLSIAELVCRVSSLSTLCTSITQAGLQPNLTDGNWTLFAPTNTAFFKIGDRLSAIFNNTDELTDLILYHAFDGLLYVDDLLCASTLQMANGQTSSTECQEDRTYQMGEGNSVNAAPQIVASNINTCNGILHIIDEVMLPANFEPVPQTAPDCKSIADIVCDSSLLSTLCTFVRQAGLESVLAGAFWTLFAPTNEAFTNLGDALDVISADTDLLTLLVLHHVAGQVLSASDLECDGSVTMTSGASTTTVCEGDAIFQTGDANDEGFPPQIIFPDIRACNGVVHVVNEVLLPHLGEPAERTQDDCQSIAALACSSDDLTTLCDLLADADLVPTLSEHSWTLFAPTNEAFANLLGGTFDIILTDRHLLRDILLYHVVGKEVYSVDLECDKKLRMADGKKTRTFCVGESMFQIGRGNTGWDALPKMVSTDMEACNGIIHKVDQVILPELH